MKIDEFITNYNLHDSLLEDIKYDISNNIVLLIVDFCYWQQNNYKNETPETGTIIIEFSETTELLYEPYKINSDEILKVYSNKENTITIMVYNDLSEECKEITIKANNVRIRMIDDN